MIAINCTAKGVLKRGDPMEMFVQPSLIQATGSVEDKDRRCWSGLINPAVLYNCAFPQFRVMAHRCMRARDYSVL